MNEIQSSHFLLVLFSYLHGKKKSIVHHAIDTRI